MSEPVPTFSEMSRTVYDSNDWFDSWPDRVVGTMQATSYEQHSLWLDWASESEWRRLGSGVRWQQRNPGTMAALKGPRFITNVSLTVAEIDGHLVLFWDCISPQCDYLLAENWIERSFPKAVEPDGRRIAADPMNFHNLLAGLRSLR